MNFSFLYKWALVLGLLLGYVAAVFAQDANMGRAKHVYELFVANQGDSIHALLTEELQEKLSPDVFKDMFKQSERQFGKLQSTGEWQKETAQGITLYYSDLKFERYSLRFLLSFDADGRMNTIRLMPVPAVSTAQPVVYNKEKMLERDVTVGADGFKLPGTLTLPVGKKKVPLVILVHGSGPNDRDETVGPNKPFRDLAWGLAERGIATVRYEKRTKAYGAACVPEGREMDYDTESVDDAVAITTWVKTLPEIDADSVYVLGHSLGATLAPRIAERADGVAGIILVAALARPFEDAIVEQVSYISSLRDSSGSAKKQIEEIKKQADNTKKLGTSEFDDKIPLLLGVPRSYWEFANAYKPVEVAVKLTLPMLILQGERDYQVTMEDFGLWRLGLLRNKNAFFKSYPKLNHMLQEGSGKATPFEYERESPVVGYVMDDIASFIRNGSLL
ncbi:alpha/beta hydrolase [Bacteroides oleiciplenus]|uniref:Alpha/beta fold hydrolase n=1 Tax=Bacteroides oleiciplenus TaxID=626931 RepID=A0A3E5BDC6_9BACE|nr:alpha/beta fold hydrolase [Bacteroides oleiciplenus]RGN35419.1 alpha/beta fold hydrolase [Bacteroides oleiciplenus]